MKNKKFTEKYSKKVSKKPVMSRKMVDYRWVSIITIITFIISISFSTLSELVIPNVNIVLSIVLVFAFVLLGILFDIVGVSITVADLKTFNSMATKRVRGAKLAVKLIKNAEKVSSFCNDVIGDICGIISGATAASIALVISIKFEVSLVLISLIVTSLVAAITIGGKAIGKSLAINKSELIVYKFSKFLLLFYKE